MDIVTISNLVNLGSAGAVIIVVVLFLKFIAAERVLDRSMWGSYLGDTVRTLEKLSLQMDQLIQANSQTALSQRIRDELTASNLRQQDTFTANTLRSRDTLTADTLLKKDDLHKGERPATDKNIA